MAESSISDLLPTASLSVSPLNDVDSRLAFELAVELSEPADILDRYELTKEQLKQKLGNPHFRQMVREYKAVWNSDLSVKERIRIKSMMMVEDSLLELYSIFQNKEFAVSARMDAFKNMAKVATVDTPDREGQAAGERINISINIPGAEKPITYEGTTVGGGDGREALPDSA